jgi:hypothetical protein
MDGGGSFIETIIRMMLGRTGRAVLAFYAEYSLAINAVVLLYGGVVLLAHANVRRVVLRMEGMILEIARQLGPAPDPRRVFERFRERWSAEAGEQQFFLPSKRDLWFTREAGSGLIGMFYIEPDYVRLVLHRNLGTPDIRSFTPWGYRAWEDHRHQLLVGIRAGVVDPAVLAARHEKRMKEALLAAKAKKKGKEKK